MNTTKKRPATGGGLTAEETTVKGMPSKMAPASMPAYSNRQPPRTFCHPDDRRIPLGKRKVSLVKWLMRKGVSLDEAKLICGRKFYREERYG